MVESIYLWCSWDLAVFSILKNQTGSDDILKIINVDRVASFCVAHILSHAEGRDLCNQNFFFMLSLLNKKELLLQVWKQPKKVLTSMWH